MTSIERTAYPQFKRLTSARVLHVFFTPAEDEVAWDAIPADVQKSFSKIAQKNKLSEFHTVSTDGKVVSYNALMLSNGNRDRVSIKPHDPALEAIPAAPATPDKK